MAFSESPPMDRIGGRLLFVGILGRQGKSVFYVLGLNAYKEGIEFEVGCRSAPDDRDSEQSGVPIDRVQQVDLIIRRSDGTVLAAGGSGSPHRPERTEDEALVRVLQGVSTQGFWWRRYWMSPLPSPGSVTFELVGAVTEGPPLIYSIETAQLREAVGHEVILFPAGEIPVAE